MDAEFLPGPARATSTATATGQRETKGRNLEEEHEFFFMAIYKCTYLTRDLIIVSLPDKRAMPPAAAQGVVPTTKVERSVS